MNACGNWAIFWPAFFAAVPVTIGAVAAFIIALRPIYNKVNGLHEKLVQQAHADGVAGRPLR